MVGDGDDDDVDDDNGGDGDLTAFRREEELAQLLGSAGGVEQLRLGERAPARRLVLVLLLQAEDVFVACRVQVGGERKIMLFLRVVTLASVSKRLPWLLYLDVCNVEFYCVYHCVQCSWEGTIINSAN